MADSRRLRVLCLHSFRTSAAILKTQMEIAGWERSLGDLVEFTCAPDGHPASGEVPKDVSMFFPDGEYYEWWNATKDEDGKTTYVGLEDSLEKVERMFLNEGPFDGVLGFSQGATLTTVLTAKGAVEGWGPFRDATRGDARDPLTFVVCVSGMLARTREAADLYSAAKNSCTPSLHVIGDADRVMPPGLSERAAAHFRDAATARHAKGHVIPKLEGETLEIVRAFFQAQRAKRVSRSGL
jgi:predicted esterase